MTRTQRAPYGSLLKGAPLAKKAEAAKPAPVVKAAKAKKAKRK